MKVFITRDVYCKGARMETGTTVDLPIADARDLMHARAAVPAPTVVERAVAEPVTETADIKPQPKRKRK